MISENILPRIWGSKTVAFWPEGGFNGNTLEKHAHNTEFVFSTAQAKPVTLGSYVLPEGLHDTCFNDTVKWVANEK